jgi:hypothetical protein
MLIGFTLVEHPTDLDIIAEAYDYISSFPWYCFFCDMYVGLPHACDS